MNERDRGCSNCEGLKECIPIRTPREYLRHLEQVKRIIDRGFLKLKEGTCPLDSIHLEGKPWPGDHIKHIFSCTQCGLMFQLSVETYHGAGGEWRVLDS